MFELPDILASVIRAIATIQVPLPSVWTLMCGHRPTAACWQAYLDGVNDSQLPYAEDSFKRHSCKSAVRPLDALWTSAQNIGNA